MIDSKINNLFINEEVNKYLDNVIKTNSFSNGYIFYGEEGIGKKQTAFRFIQEIFKKSLLSKNIEERILNKNHPDLLIIEPSSSIKSKQSKSLENYNLEVIKIEQVRNIKIFLSQKPLESDMKIVFIDNAHLLNEAASNCLLKTLEEPNNGIFILKTSKLNLLLDTIKSRCQLVKFKSFSSKKIENLVNENLDSSLSKSKINKNLNFQDLVNLANGSPGKLLNKIQIWNELSDDILVKLETPLNNELEIFKISKLITERLEIFQQISLIEYLQFLWWRKTNNANLVKKLEKLKFHLRNFIQPRLAWEVVLLQIAIEL